MSAPDTDTETQKKRHRHAIRGIKTAIIVGALLMILGIVIAVLRATSPEPRSAIEAEVSAAQGSWPAGAAAAADLQE